MSTSIVQVGSADKLGRFNIMIVTSVVCYAMLFGWWNLLHRLSAVQLHQARIDISAEYGPARFHSFMYIHYIVHTPWPNAKCSHESRIQP